MHTITARIDEKDKALLQWLVEKKQTSKSELIRTMLKQKLRDEVLKYCFEEYQRGNLSFSKIAEITDVPLIDVLNIAREKKVIYHYSADELEEDLKTLKNF